MAGRKLLTVHLQSQWNFHGDVHCLLTTMFRSGQKSVLVPFYLPSGYSQLPIAHLGVDPKKCLCMQVKTFRFYVKHEHPPLCLRNTV